MPTARVAPHRCPPLAATIVRLFGDGLLCHLASITSPTRGHTRPTVRPDEEARDDGDGPVQASDGARRAGRKGAPIPDHWVEDVHPPARRQPTLRVVDHPDGNRWSPRTGRTWANTNGRTTRLPVPRVDLVHLSPIAPPPWTRTYEQPHADVPAAPDRSWGRRSLRRCGGRCGRSAALPCAAARGFVAGHVAARHGCRGLADGNGPPSDQARPCPAPLGPLLRAKARPWGAGRRPANGVRRPSFRTARCPRSPSPAGPRRRSRTAADRRLRATPHGGTIDRRRAC